MTKEFILDRIKKGSYSQKELIGWMECLPVLADSRKPSEHKVGDVFMHSVFKHPYVLLKKTKEDYICGLMTSNEEFPDNLCECESRFFRGKYFTKVLFKSSGISGSFINVYENQKHLREVLKSLKNIL